MADNSSGQLPPGWVLDSKRLKDGSEITFYRNLGTGQKFNTAEELFRYVNYAKNTLPLINSGKLTFKDFMKEATGASASKGEASAESSCVSVDVADTATTGGGKEKQGSSKSKKKSKKSKGRRT